MHITWYGHAAFGITTQNSSGESLRIVMDPYNYPDCGGYLPVGVQCDLVSISHENQKYHSDVSSLLGDFTLIDGLELAASGGSKRGSGTFLGIPFEAIEVYEDDQSEGPNAMVKFTSENLTIAHQGDLGHALNQEQLDFLQGVDILLALTGGNPTIALEDQMDLIERVRPSLIIPMHYKTEKVNLDILPKKSFLDQCEGYPVIEEGDFSVEINRDFLPEATTILVLEHSR